AALRPSPTTRRAGLVSLVDMGPTVLRFLGLEEEQPAHWTGRPMTATAAGPSRWEGLTAWSREVLANHHRRVPLLQGYVTVQIIVVLTAVGLLLWPAPRRLLAPRS